MQVQTGKSNGVREKMQNLRVVKVTVTRMEQEEVLLLIISLQVVD